MRLPTYIAISVLLALALAAMSPGRGASDARAQQVTQADAVPQAVPGGNLDDVFFYSGPNLPGHAVGRVEQSNGDGTFTAFPAREDFSNTFDVYPGDFNGDGLTDMFFYNFNGSGNDAVVLLSDGRGGWIDQDAFHIDAGWTVTPGYYNNDNLEDLFFYNVNTGDAIVDFANPGGATFTQGALENIGAGWRRMPANFRNPATSLGHVLTDLVLFNLDHVNQENMRVILADGHGGWTEKTTTSISFDSFVYPGDYNGDGITDVFVVAGSAGPTTIGNVFYADGQGGWNAGPSDSTIPAGWGVYPGDYDGDGVTDIFMYDSASHSGQFMFSNAGTDWSKPPVDTSFDANWRVFPGHFEGGSATSLLLYNGATAAATPNVAVVISAKPDRSGDWSQSAVFMPGDDFAQVVVGNLGPGLYWGDVDCSGAPADIGDAIDVERSAVHLPVTKPADCPAINDPVTIAGNADTWGDVDCSGVPADIGDAIDIERSAVQLPVTKPASCPAINDPITLGAISQ